MAGMRYQPQGNIRLNKAHPLAQGLVFAAVPGGPELLSGVWPLRLGSAAISAFDQGKSYYTPSASAAGWYWPVASNHPIYTITSQDSILALLKTSTRIAYSSLFSVPYRATGWTTPYKAWGLGASSDTSIPSFNFATNSTTSYTATGASGYFSDSAVRTHGSTRNGARVRFYVNRSQHGEDVAITAGSPDWTNRAAPVLFNRSSGSLGEGILGNAALILAWNRELSPEEWRAISSNPWQIFDTQSGQEITYFAKSSGSQISIVSVSGSSTGVASLTATARAIYSAYGSSVGTGGANSSVIAISTVSGTASGTSETATASIILSVTNGISTSVANVAANSYALWNVVGSSASFASTETQAVSFFEAIANATGEGFAQADTVLVACATGSSTGIVSVESVSVAIYNADAASISASEVQAVVVAVVEAVAQSEGAAAVSGTTEGGMFYTAKGDKFSVTVTFSPYTIEVEGKPYTIILN